jgi:hypothetical protein
MERAPLTPKQKVAVIALLGCLQWPRIAFCIYWAETPGMFSARFISAAFAINMIVGVSLRALITEKWIRKMY